MKNMPGIKKDTEKSGTKAASFESSFTRLEEVVRKLEEGKLTLDQASALFEEGMQLAKACNEALSSAELRITRLRSNFAEQMNLVPDDEGDAEYDDEGDDD
jgi:exodeoxyribonuclease VII small subunit